MSATLKFPSAVSPPKAGYVTEKCRVRQDLWCSVGDGAAFGAMVGLGETYFAAFALAIGLGELVAGMMGSLPLLMGGLLQLISPAAIRKLGSHKRWVVLCAAVQAFAFLPMLLAAWHGSISAPAILLAASIYWGAGLATGPAWNTWIGTLVPVPMRARFFASRTRISQACVFLGFLVSGLALQWASQHEAVLEAYVWLFAAAGVCRLLSVWMLTSHREPMPIPCQMKSLPIRTIFRQLSRGAGGKLLVFLIAVQAAVQISGPYFTPFMFNSLGLSYGEFVALIAIAFLARIFTLPLWGRYAQEFGAMRLLWLGAIGITPISAGWVISQNFGWLLLLQAVSGAVWAAYELAFFLLFFESIPEEERTGMLTVYNLINTLSWVCGALVGGLILYAMQTTVAGYLTIFALSSVGRLLALLLLAKIPRFDVTADEIEMRTLAIRPNGNSLNSPVLPSLPDQRIEDPAVQAS